ncbi:NepR family anti-sigma factor [Pararhodobacter marinus]|uniref:RNA polymerase subunit sigma-70 n=1 Tax=Pararhodobacter marinus TaxID=2184063 RepID=A0A2U2C887_9RHOB|nr:NepR family anti-sigma factor [Pararhodobacter marinus]PWE28004.1 RNA polymerase subunit sigma-70 [Pararhodobacter marinus]
MQQDNHNNALEDQIAENLRRAFSERAEEKVPDRFMDLLQQLREQDSPRNDRSSNDN